MTNKINTSAFAVRYAKELEHKTIGYLQGTAPTQHYKDYLAALDDYDLLDCSHPLLQLADTEADAQKAALEFLRHRPRGFRFPSIFIAPSDAIALGAMTAFRDLGYHIPEDISFIGYGNAPEGAAFEPPLTTIDVNGNLIERDSVFDLR